ncbi:MAG: hypothetical protein ACXVX8_15615, partial [Blastococcus sp.]
LLDAKRLIPLTDITGTAEADIEDLFDSEWYSKLVAAAGIGKVAKSKLNGGGRIVKQIEAALGGRYDHYQPASHLLRDGGALVDQIDEDTRDRFEQLFKRLNGLLAPA